MTNTHDVISRTPLPRTHGYMGPHPHHMDLFKHVQYCQVDTSSLSERLSCGTEFIHQCDVAVNGVGIA